MASSSPLLTLLAPFDQELISWGERTLFMGADWIETPGDCDYWQYFKPASDRLTAHGKIPLQEFPTDENYDLVIAHLPKQIDEAKYWIARSLKVLSEGGTLAVSASNDAGGTRLEKWMEEAGLSNIQSYSKNKARVVWGVKTSGVEKSDWLEGGDIRRHDFGDGVSFLTQPGLFSWDRIDNASRLLIETMPGLKGAGADFGCGYGYLSYSVLKKNSGITSLSMVDADTRAITCALKNIEEVKGAAEITSCWHDATKPVPCLKPLDFIVMNPPFHTGKSTDPDLGQAMIRTAASHLKKNGNLWLVANTHLPYEKLMGELFRETATKLQKSGFKIIHAVKG